MPDEAGDIASAVIAMWSAGFSRLDADALAALYSKHAFFFGSNPMLYRGRDGVKAYAEGDSPWCLLDSHHRHMESRWYQANRHSTQMTTSGRNGASASSRSRLSAAICFCKTTLPAWSKMHSASSLACRSIPQ